MATKSGGVWIAQVPVHPDRYEYIHAHIHLHTCIQHTGVGGLVLDDEGNVLLVAEKYRHIDKLFWKLPGGLADQGIAL